MPPRRLALSGFAVAAVFACARPSSAGLSALAEAMAFTPPDCADLPFNDVSLANPYCRWIQQAKSDGVLASCDGNGNYCPEGPVTRQQLAMVVERAMRGTGDWDPWRGSYRRTLIVNPVLSGDPPVVDASSSGQRLLDVLGSIPDDGDPYLVKIEPGDYDIGPASIELRSRLRLEGAGPRLTRILAESPNLGAALVASQVVAALADLQLVVTGGGGTVAAVRNTDAALDLRQVWIDITGGGVVYGLQIEGDGFSEVREASLRATSSGNLAAAVYSNSASATLRMYGSTATGNGFRSGFPSGVASRGVLADNASIELNDCRVNAQAASSTNYAVALVDSAQGLIRGGGARAGTGAAVALYVQDSALDVDGGEFVAYSGTTTRAARCIATTGSGSIDVARAYLFGVSALYGDAGCPIRARFSQLQGAVTLNGGTVTCRAVTDAANNFLASTCP